MEVAVSELLALWRGAKPGAARRKTSPTLSLCLAMELDALIEIKASQIGKEGEKTPMKMNSLRDAACQCLCWVTPPANSRNVNRCRVAPSSAQNANEPPQAPAALPGGWGGWRGALAVLLMLSGVLWLMPA